MAPPQKFLLFTNSEYGQANVFLALAYELSLRPNVEVHIASFLPLRKRIAPMQDLVHAAGGGATIHFHLCRGKTFQEGLNVQMGTDFGTMGGMAHPPGLRGALEAFKIIPMVSMPYTCEEYVEIYTSCLDIISAVEPVGVLIDPLFRPPMDACKKQGVKHIILSPVSLKDNVLGRQPWLAAFWKHPVTMSGYPYPLPWYLIPLNMYLMIRLIFCLVTSAHLKTISTAREQCGLKNLPEIFETGAEGIHHLTPATPTTDFPLFIPDNVTPCGPILLPTLSLDDSDPELSAWLDKGPAVLINLGTHAHVDAEGVRQMGGAIRILLDRDPNVRVIWKVISQGDIRDVIPEVLGKEMDGGRVKIVTWLNAEPLAILRHPNLMCSVNHGGANSCYEAISTGTPQIVLPVWIDTYDFARRVEYLGIGIYGSQTSAPGVDASELGKALMRAVGDGEEAIRMRARAKALAEENKQYTGRVLACDKVLELAAGGYFSH